MSIYEEEKRFFEQLDLPEGFYRPQSPMEKEVEKVRAEAVAKVGRDLTSEEQWGLVEELLAKHKPTTESKAICQLLP